MIETGLSFLLGLVLGGFSVSACWGVFWLVLAIVGVARGTSGWKVVRASLAAGTVPLVLALVLLWSTDPARLATWPFLIGAAALPVLLLGLALRKLPDGTRVGGRLVGGAQAMMDTILGKHQGCGDCGGCGDEHPH